MLTQLTIFLYIVIFLHGIVIGSFLNVLIFRIPKKENIVQSSHCMNCGRKLGWRDMVPVFSYIILRGRCRQCGARISIQYPLIEALNGVLYVVVFMAGGFTFSSVLYCLMTSALIVIAVIDEPGEFMGDAVAQVLFGDYNPGGKLAVTFPRSVGQIPFAFPFKPGSDSKGFVRVTGTLYPFGYGLSYTTFAYSDLKIENPVIGVQGSVKLSCKVKNTGKVAGDEVVQLYLHDEMSSVTTYVKVLRGFERIHLEPGEEKVIDFVLTPQELGLWNKDNHFVVEPGTFAVMVGSSSQDIKLQGKFEVK